MSNLFKIIRASGIFFGGTIIAMILDLIIPIINDTLVDITGLTALNYLIWFIVLIIYLAGIIVIPSVLTYNAITEETPNRQGNEKLILQILTFVFILTLIAVGYFIVPNFANMIESTYTRALFWLGFFSIFLLNTLFYPIHAFSESKNVN